MYMNVLVAPNSMKGSLSSIEFADIIEKTLINNCKEVSVKKLPVADGGGQTAEILAKHFNARKITIEAQNPIGNTIPTTYYIAQTTAIIEMANISGLHLLKMDQLNPLKASSFGLGEVILDAIKQECKHIILGIGGSATIDGGIGMLAALGWKFFNANGAHLQGNGENLNKVKHAEPGVLIPYDIRFTVLCDVKNTLAGINGAAYVYGPQKGATSKMVKILDEGLTNWSEILSQISGINVKDIPGSGAAGGVATALVAYYNASLKMGSNYIFERLNFERHVQWADLVITGEGKLDYQTLENKAPAEVARIAARHKKPVVAIVGQNSLNQPNYFKKVYSLIKPGENITYAIENVHALVEKATLKLIGQFIHGQ